MSTISTEERREVAQNMRDGVKSKTEYEMLSLNGSSAAIRWLISYVVFGDKKYHSGVDLMNRLADLIEPGEQKVRCVAEVKIDGERLEELVCDAAVKLTGIDRGALLALASTIIEARNALPYKTVDWTDVVTISRSMLDDIARRIREACGEAVA